tara:strand:+ start:223 stop:333 length:111 start_codon:yes stop_codon:yes gene_type:complete
MVDIELYNLYIELYNLYIVRCDVGGRGVGGLGYYNL